MLELTANQYRIAISNDPTYSLGSADNISTYDREYALDDARAKYTITSRHAIRVFEAHNVIQTCILLAGGGASGIHAHSAIVRDESCVIAVGPFLASLRIPGLELQWTTQTDAATCFGVYCSGKHQCLISHGELEIARVSFDGDISWQSSGADIFTNGFTLHEDWVQVIDFYNREYRFDIATGLELKT